MSALARAGLVTRRELAAERRQPDGIVAALTFTAALVLLESIVIGPAVARQLAVAPALFWVALLFAAIVTASRSFERELEDDALDAVLALPGGRDALYAGKVAALALALALVALIAGALSIVLLDLSVALPLHLLLATVLGVAALAPLVVLDVALALRLRSRAALVPILALPVLLPQLVAGTNAVAAALTGDGPASLAWSGLLLAFALVYGVLGLTIVPAAIE